VARPRGTSQYPEDEPILDQIQADLTSGKYSSKTAAAEAYLNQIGGPTPEARIRRILRKIRQRQRDAEIVELGELVQALSDLPSTKDRVKFLADIDRDSRRTVEAIQKAGASLIRSGVDIRSETGAQMLKALAIVELNPNKL